MIQPKRIKTVKKALTGAAIASIASTGIGLVTSLIGQNKAKKEAEKAQALASANNFNNAMQEQDIYANKFKNDNINESIKSYTNRQKDLIVSEHAILRYLLRVQGLDIAQVARDLVPDRIKEQIKMLGNGTYPIPEKGFKIVVKENVIVTIHAMEE